MPGTYTVTYDVSDDSANASDTVTRTVIVEDTIPPEITLSGESSMTVECGDEFEDPGATAYDDCDGDVTDCGGTGSGVDPSQPGEYTIKYNASDSAGNEAETVTRTVTVVDTTPPVITLNGESSVTVECGDGYTDAGATVTDACDGDLTGSLVVVNSVNALVLGEYTITYNVSDSSSNAATEVIRTVKVEDTTAPVITLYGDNPAAAECGEPYTDAGAIAIDACEGDLTGSIVTINQVNKDIPGTYTITYNINDSLGNVAQEVTRTVIVEDNKDPWFVPREGTITVECNGDYIGVIAYDACDKLISDRIVTTLNISIPGEQTVTYSVSDSSGNTFEAIYTVYVVDTQSPVITLIGDAEVVIDCGGTYIDEGATASDVCDGNLTGSIAIANSVDTSKPGNYTVNYHVVDSASNVATVTRTVTILDNCEGEGEGEPDMCDDINLTEYDVSYECCCTEFDEYCVDDEYGRAGPPPKDITITIENGEGEGEGEGEGVWPGKLVLLSVEGGVDIDYCFEDTWDSGCDEGCNECPDNPDRLCRKKISNTKGFDQNKFSKFNYEYGPLSVRI